MTPEQTREVFRIVLAGWATQRQRMSAEDIQGMAAFYTAGLADLEFEVVKAAITRVGRTSKFLPTVAEIREQVDVVKHGTQITGGEAWGEVISKMRRYGSHRTPGEDFTFDDAITARVVRAFGWTDLCGSMNMIADRARFIDAYEQIAKAEHLESRAADGVNVRAIAAGSSRPAMATTEVRQIAAPEERSAILREVLDDSRAVAPGLVGSFVNGIAKNLGLDVGDDAPEAKDVH